jgi:hypothetical protein
MPDLWSGISFDSRLRYIPKFAPLVGQLQQSDPVIVVASILRLFLAASGVVEALWC